MCSTTDMFFTVCGSSSIHNQFGKVNSSGFVQAYWSQVQHQAACIMAECSQGASQSGRAVSMALDALMTGDFDPDQYDKQMAAAFGDDYYGVCFCCHARASLV